jgi:hypothetical protein
VAESPFAGEIETVRGELAGDRAEQVVGFLAERAGLTRAEAGEELPRVVCLALDPGGALAGVGAVSEAAVPLIGGVRLWLHRVALLAEATEAHDAMVAAAFEALEKGYDPEEGGPIGLCQVTTDPDEMRRTPEAVSPRTGLLHAGFLEDGSQIRVRYFDQASIGPRVAPLAPVGERTQPPPLDERHRIESLADSVVTPDDVLALWARERAIPAAVAERRVHDVDLVAIDERDGLVGIGSSYLQRNGQLRMDLRYFRAFVAETHRSSSLATALTFRDCEHLEGLYVSGTDRRASGVICQVENDLLQRHRNEARWAATDLNYIGQSANGSHVRVRYFPGVRIPVPD